MKVKHFWGAMLLFIAPLAVSAAQPDITTTFHFRNDLTSDTLYVLRRNNQAELQRLYAFIDQHREVITSSKGKNAIVEVFGFASGLGTERENRQAATTRSNVVKSDLIIRRGLVEDNFITRNVVQKHPDGSNSAVDVRITIPGAPAPAPKPAPAPAPAPKPKPEPKPAPKPAPAPAPAPAPKPAPAPAPAPAPVVKQPAGKPYSFALRTNLLYDVMLLPTIGIEWRVTPGFGIKVDGSYSHWKLDKKRVQNIAMLSPELRWYMGANKRWYAGLGGNFGSADVNGGIWGYGLHKAFNAKYKTTGYDGNFMGGGIVGGYQAHLNRSFSLDFNLGLGMTHYKYDVYRINTPDPTGKYARIPLANGQTRNFWGPTQAGISLVWTMGGAASKK